MEVKRYIPLIRLYAVREKELEYETPDLDCPEKVEKVARNVIGNADREMLVVLSVNNRNKPVALEIISIGTISEAIAQAAFTSAENLYEDFTVLLSKIR